MSLPIKETIQKLHSYNNSHFPILSVYLNATQDDLQKQFDELTHKALSDRDISLLDKSLMYIEGFLMNYSHDDQVKGLAIFSGGDNLFETIKTQIHFEPQLAAAHSPFLEPILKQLDAYQRYLVILADRENAKFMIIRDGAIERVSHLVHDDVPQSMTGRNFEEREDIVDRHIEDHLHRHIKHVMSELEHFLHKQQCAGIIFGTHDELKKYLYQHIPAGMKNNILGEIDTKTIGNDTDIFKKAQKIISSQHQHSSSPLIYITQ